MENFASLLERAFILLECGEWKKADEYFEKVLDMQPKNADAYLGKLLAELQIKTREELKNAPLPFDENTNYQLMMRFGNEDLQTYLTQCIAIIKERNKNAEVEKTYNVALKIMSNCTLEAFAQAEALFGKISDYKNADALAKECAEKAEALANEINKKYKAEQKRLAEEKAEQEKIIKLSIIQNKKRRKSTAITALFLVVCLVFNIVITMLRPNYSPISIGQGIIFAIKNDGSIISVGDNYEKLIDVKNWKNIVSIQIGLGCAVGLKNDGSVLCNSSDKILKEKIENWKNIIAISATDTNIVGLKSNGTVVNVCYNSTPDGYNPNDVSEYINNTAKSEDTVNKKYRTIEQIDDWKEITAISAASDYVMGLKKDGTVIFSDSREVWSDDKFYSDKSTKNWEGIISICAEFYFAVGLKSDGKVVAISNFGFENIYEAVSDWRDVISISTCDKYIVGLKKDGSVITTCTDKSIKKELESWENIAYIDCGTYYRSYWNYANSECCVIGVTKDGTVLYAGDNSELRSEIESWSNIKTP